MEYQSFVETAVHQPMQIYCRLWIITFEWFRPVYIYHTEFLIVFCHLYFELVAWVVIVINHCQVISVVLGRQKNIAHLFLKHSHIAMYSEYKFIPKSYKCTLQEIFYWINKIIIYIIALITMSLFVHDWIYKYKYINIFFHFFFIRGAHKLLDVFTNIIHFL